MNNISDEIQGAEHAWRSRHLQNPNVLRLSVADWERLKAHCLRIAGPTLSGPHQDPPIYGGMRVDVVAELELIDFAVESTIEEAPMTNPTDLTAAEREALGLFEAYDNDDRTWKAGQVVTALARRLLSQAATAPREWDAAEIQDAPEGMYFVDFDPKGSNTLHDKGFCLYLLRAWSPEAKASVKYFGPMPLPQAASRGGEG